MIEPEEWRPVVGWEGLYEVSSLGRVRSLDRTTECVNRWGRIAARNYPGRALTPNTAGAYPQVTLASAARREHRYVHQLVCIAFHGARPEGQEVAHGDGDRMNARADNLRWATRSDNHHDKRDHGTLAAGERHKTAKLSAAQVGVILISGDKSAKEFAELYGVSAEHVRLIRRGKSRNVPGYP